MTELLALALLLSVQPATVDVPVDVQWNQPGRVRAVERIGRAKPYPIFHRRRLFRRRR